MRHLWLALLLAGCAARNAEVAVTPTPDFPAPVASSPAPVASTPAAASPLDPSLPSVSAGGVSPPYSPPPLKGPSLQPSLPVLAPAPVPTVQQPVVVAPERAAEAAPLQPVNPALVAPSAP